MTKRIALRMSYSILMLPLSEMEGTIMDQKKHTEMI